MNSQTDGCKILTGPPVPALMPEKGFGVFLEEGRIKFFVISRFNGSDTTIRTEVNRRDAFRVLWNLLRKKSWASQPT